MKVKPGRVLGGAAALLVVSQLVPVDRSNPPETGAMPLPAGEAGQILEAACMDCHSHRTVWPWYASVTPVKFLVAKHVKDGRGDLNFSTWSEQELRRRDHKLEEVVEMVKSGEMPEKSYSWLHPAARLTDDQRRVVTEWAEAERARLQEPPAPAAADSLAPADSVPGDTATAGGAPAGGGPGL